MPSMSSTTTLQPQTHAWRTEGITEPAPVSLRQQNRNRSNAVDDQEIPLDATSVIPNGGYGWKIVFSCFFLNFWLNGYCTAWGVLQTAMIQSNSLKASIQSITFVGSLSMAVLVAGALFAVRLMNAYGSRYTNMAAVTLCGTSLVCASFTLRNIGGLFVVAGVSFGIGGALLFAVTSTIPLQWFSTKLGLANGIVKAGGGVGATVVPLLSQALIDRVGLEWTFRILGFLILGTGFPLTMMLKDRFQSNRASRLDWSLLKNKPFLALSAAAAIGVFGLYVPPFFLPLFSASIGLPASTGAALVAGFGAAGAIGRLAAGWVSDRIGPFNALALAALLNAMSMLAIWPVSSSSPPLFVFALINGCANGGFFVGLPNAAAAIAPASAAASISLMTTFYTPGYLLGPAIAGILIEATGATQASSIGPYRAAIFYAAGTGLLSTLLAVSSRLMIDSKVIKKL